MKKRYLILAGILAASMLAAGCGKKSSVAPEQKVEATVTPTVTEAAKSDVVEMQTSTDDTANIKNVMGTKSETTTSIVFTNKIDSTISAIYVRPTRDDGDDSDETWGSDLVNGKFTLASNDKAVYYMEKSQKDDDGNAVTSFDVRVTFSDEDQNDCFFRQLPLLTISQLNLCILQTELTARIVQIPAVQIPHLLLRITVEIIQTAVIPVTAVILHLHRIQDRIHLQILRIQQKLHPVMMIRLR